MVKAAIRRSEGNPQPVPIQVDWQRLFDSMGDGVAIVSLDHRILRANQALARMVSAGGPDDLVGRKCYEVVHGLRSELESCPLDCCRSDKKTGEIERQEPHLNNIWLSLRVDPLLGTHGEVTGVIHTFRDITLRKEMDRLKEEFIGLVSHELRNPLTVIIGALQTALSEEDRLPREEVRHLIIDAAEEAHSLSDMVGNMLDLARAEARRLTLAPEPLDFETTALGMVAKFRARHPTREFIADLPASLPAVRADRLRLERVLHNLLHNAVKYSPGSTAIRVFARADGGELLVGVEDHGIGISPGDLAKLFEPFQRAENASQVDAEGVGLGLVVCRRVVEAHGGRIWVESAPGRGSTFRFTIPLSEGTRNSRANS